MIRSIKIAATKMSIQTIAGCCEHYRLGNFTATRWRVHEKGDCTGWTHTNIDKCKTNHISTVFTWHLLGSGLQRWVRESRYASRWLYTRIFHPSKLVRTTPHANIQFGFSMVLRLCVSFFSLCFLLLVLNFWWKGGVHAGVRTDTWKYSEIAICAVYRTMPHMQLFKY